MSGDWLDNPIDPDAFGRPLDPATGPDPSSIVVPVVIEQPEEDHERALPEDVELHVIEDAAARFERQTALVLDTITAEERDLHGAHESDITATLYQHMPPIMTRHLLAYMHDLGLVQRRGIRGKGVYWKRVQ